MIIVRHAVNLVSCTANRGEGQKWIVKTAIERNSLRMQCLLVHFSVTIPQKCICFLLFFSIRHSVSMPHTFGSKRNAEQVMGRNWATNILSWTIFAQSFRGIHNLFALALIQRGGTLCPALKSMRFQYTQHSESSIPQTVDVEKNCSVRASEI